jgi:hypothetical protein
VSDGNANCLTRVSDDSFGLSFLTYFAEYSTLMHLLFGCKFISDLSCVTSMERKRKSGVREYATTTNDQLRFMPNKIHC